MGKEVEEVDKDKREEGELDIHEEFDPSSLSDEEFMKFLRKQQDLKNKKETDKILLKMVEMEEGIKTTVKDAVKEAVKEVKDEDKDKDKVKEVIREVKKIDTNLTKPIKQYDKNKLLTFLNDLQRDNFIMKYIDTMTQMTSSYPEYHFAFAISILSIISDRKLKLSMRHKDIYPNIWFYLLGLSTVSQKSTAFELGEEFVRKLSVETGNIELIKNRMPGSFSPEGFGEALEECDGHGYEWKDESGDLLKNMEKEYMSNMRDTLCDLHGCKTFHRKLKKSFLYVENPFVNMILATTPDTFREYTNITDLTSGWLYRYMYLYPEYDKNWMPIGKRSNEDNNKINELVVSMKKKVELISKLRTGDEINFEFESGCLEFYEKWSERMFYRAQKGKNQIEAAFIGRLEDYVLKLAVIFTFGEPAFKKEISIKMMEIICQLVENYFLPMALKIADMVKITKDNSIEKVLDIITTNGGKISRNDLLRKARLKARELDDIILTLIESDEVDAFMSNRTKWYRLMKQK